MTLPNFLVIGAAKAGTTSFIHYLGQHPEVYINTGVAKLADFFCRDAANGAAGRVRPLADYENLFDGAERYKAIGEVTGRYMSSASAAGLLQEHLPQVRLIATLRNPVDRAYSGYLMQVRKGRERRDPEACFRRGDGYVEGGFYSERLRPYFDCFPREQIKVCLLEDLKADSRAVFADVFSFLDVDPTFVADTSEAHNMGGYPKNRWVARLFTSKLVQERLAPLAPSGLKRMARRVRSKNLVKTGGLPPEIRGRLVQLYRDDVERLQDLIQRDLSRWLA